MLRDYEQCSLWEFVGIDKPQVDALTPAPDLLESNIPVAIAPDLAELTEQEDGLLSPGELEVVLSIYALIDERSLEDLALLEVLSLPQKHQLGLLEVMPP